MMQKTIQTLGLLLVVFATQPHSFAQPWPGSIEQLLRDDDRFKHVLERAETHRLQIIYTQIDRDSAGHPSFTRFDFRLNENEYFYPASTVKLPVALLSLEKLARVKASGIDRNTPMHVHNIDGAMTTSSIADDIYAIFTVSDNDAYNRLYDFLGRDAIKQSLISKGYQHSRIVHRLGGVPNAQRNRLSAPIEFVQNSRSLYTREPVQSAQLPSNIPPLLLGHAEMINGERVAGAKNFANKNWLSLNDLHDMLKALIFADSVEASARFQLNDSDRQFLLRAMSAYPDDQSLAQGYVKFLLFGGDEQHIPVHISVFNKVGDAFGFVTDCAYIIDREHGVEFMLAATMYVNANQTFNDDVYEVDSIALPFLRDLGRTLLRVERQRNRTHAPTFTEIALD